MRIPKIIHQLWKDVRVPTRWQDNVKAVKKYHKGWEYRLWTDDMIDAYVREKHSGFYPIFSGFNRHIMRVDIFRYVLMNDLGGLYCDLDYEFLRPYEYGEADVVLSLERQVKFGDDADIVANYFMASTPGHAFWRDILDDVETNPPYSSSVNDVGLVSGPGLVSRIFLQNQEKYDGIRLTEQPVFSPRRVHGPHERKIYRNTGLTYGFHHGAGTWRERWSLAYIQRKLTKLLRL